MIDQQPSPFLQEIPSNLIPHEDCSYWSIAQVNQFCADWLGTKAKSSSEVYVPNFTPTSPRQQVSKPDPVILRYTPTGHSGRARRKISKQAKNFHYVEKKSTRQTRKVWNWNYSRD